MDLYFTNSLKPDLLSTITFKLKDNFDLRLISFVQPHFEWNSKSSGRFKLLVEYMRMCLVREILTEQKLLIYSQQQNYKKIFFPWRLPNWNCISVPGAIWLYTYQHFSKSFSFDTLWKAKIRIHIFPSINWRFEISPILNFTLISFSLSHQLSYIQIVRFECSTVIMYHIFSALSVLFLVQRL